MTFEISSTEWQNAVETREDEASLPQFRRLCSLLDEEPARLTQSSDVPVHWSAILFADIASQSKLRSDGHPRHGDFIPVMPLPKRMFAGRTVEQFRPISIGDRLLRRSTISSVESKEGRSGPLIFLTVLHEITGLQGLCYTETQQVVFREDSPSGAGGKAAEEMPPPRWQSEFTPDPIMLFRYSALTFNGHRIHYDFPYAKEIEGYPALVVNGGLTTLMLLEFARKSVGRVPVKYTVRAMRPLFANGKVRLLGAEAADVVQFWAIDEIGNPAMKVEIGKFA